MSFKKIILSAVTLFVAFSASATEAGSIVAWGYNEYGQCNVPSPNTGFVAVAAGWGHSLALKQDGSIVAWGSNWAGQCNVPAPNSSFVAIGAGSGHSLALKQDGSIAAWGHNGEGQCTVPAPNTGFVAITAGDWASLGLKQDGSIVLWGSGSVPYPVYDDVPAPNSGFVAIASGGMHSLGLKQDGSIVAWGYNMNGTCDVPAPNTGFAAVAAGSDHGLALKPDGSIVAWGLNFQGQCNVPAPNTGFVAFDGGHCHSLALKQEGSIVAWGYNAYGQCNVASPNTGFTAIAAGGYHSLAIREEIHPPWSFVQITDLHIGYEGAEERFIDALRQIEEENHELILVTGDIVEYAAIRENYGLWLASGWFDRYKSILEYYPDPDLRSKVREVPGNHDRGGIWQVHEDWFWINYGLSVYEEYVRQKDDYSFHLDNHGGVEFIGMDTGWGDFPGDGLKSDQVEWLRKLLQVDLARTTHKVIFLHHPALDTHGLDQSFNNHRKEFFQYIDSNNVDLVLAGHTHEDHVDGSAGTWHVQTSSMGKSDPSVYRIIDVKNGVAKPRFEVTEVKRYDKKIASLHSPGNLHIYDSLGRHVGMINSGEVERGIPDSFYFSHYSVTDGDAQIIHSLPEEIFLYDTAQDYIYRVVGTEEGTYRLDITSVSGGEESAFEAIDIPTSPGERHVYTVDWPALSAGEEGVTLEIDADGDEVFERTVIADEDLTSEEFSLQMETVIDFEPDTLNLGSRAKVVTVYIELPEGFDVSQIDVSTVKLNDSVSALPKPVEISDYDIDGVPDLMVKFDCGQVAQVLEAGLQAVTLTGRLSDGTLFGGIDTIRVIGSVGAAAAESELESVAPQEDASPRQKKPATTEADAVGTGASGAFDVKEGVAFMLLEACQTINELGPENFNSEESAIELTTTLDALFGMLDEGLYIEALAMLDNDVLQRMDGCANTGQPDEDDWIRSFDGQALVYPLIVETIELLESLI